MATLSRIFIYPLKSFDPISVDRAHVLPSGALEHDRRFALVDSAGKLVNAKRFASIHALEVHLDPDARSLSIRRRVEDSTTCFDVDTQRKSIEQWFSDYFSLTVSLVENVETGFPDDGEAPGPTLVGAASLLSVTEWFPGLTLDEARLRFRANLEVAGVEAFWEDRLFNRIDAGDRPFQIADVVFGGSNPCQRCVVPTRNPSSGEIWPEFAKRFSSQREATLPEWASRDRFNHFYRLTVNTRLLSQGRGVLQVGDPVDVLAFSAH